jgi:hypothetical protein
LPISRGMFPVLSLSISTGISLVLECQNKDVEDTI